MAALAGFNYDVWNRIDIGKKMCKFFVIRTELSLTAEPFFPGFKMLVTERPVERIQRGTDVRKKSLLILFLGMGHEGKNVCYAYDL